MAISRDWLNKPGLVHTVEGSESVKRNKIHILLQKNHWCGLFHEKSKVNIQNRQIYGGISRLMVARWQEEKE